MSLKSIEAYLSSGLVTVEDEVKAAFAKLSAWWQTEQAKISGEIEHLRGHGYAVVPPAATVATVGQQPAPSVTLPGAEMPAQGPTEQA